jgi:hypothetical protein
LASVRRENTGVRPGGDPRELVTYLPPVGFSFRETRELSTFQRAISASGDSRSYPIARLVIATRPVRFFVVFPMFLFLAVFLFSRP